MNTSLKQLKITRESKAYWRVTFDNPPINVLDAATMPELLELISIMESDPELRVVVFDSANPDFFIAHFSAAAGLDPIVTPRPNGLFPWVDFVDRVSKLPVVTVAAIRGRARGVGSEFALACDIRFGSREKAILAQIEVGVGLFPGGGAMERLPRLVGRGRALEIILGADDFDAETAEKYGWINRAIPDTQFEEFVDTFARRIASFDRQAIAEAKRLVNAHNDEPTAASINESQQFFFGAYRWPGVAARIPKLAALGTGQHSDLELNYGRVLGGL
jgi:enoyl-CoA hydratase/carnithine racemase